jgi:hypothetical protein
MSRFVWIARNMALFAAVVAVPWLLASGYWAWRSHLASTRIVIAAAGALVICATLMPANPVTVSIRWRNADSPHAN